METVKQLLTGILFITMFAHLGFAQECDELTNNLLDTEMELKTRVVKNCGDNCINLLEAETEYNKAIALVNTYESLIAIGQAAEGDHRSLKNMTRGDLKTAKTRLDNFIKSIQKVDILKSAMVIDESDASGKIKTLWHIDKKEANSDFKAIDRYNVNDDPIYKGARFYDGESVEDLKVHLTLKCSAKNKAFKSFCDKIGEFKDDKFILKPDDNNYLKMLHNFGKSQYTVDSTNLGEHATNLKEKYSPYLDVKLDGKSVNTELFLDYKNNNASQALSQNKEFKNYLNLKKLLPEDYDPTKASAATNEKIIKLANKLSDLSVNFGEGVTFNTNSNLNKQFTQQMQDSLKKDFTNINSISGLLTNQSEIENNLTQSKNMLDQEMEASFQIFAKKFKDAPSPGIPAKCADTDTIVGIDNCFKTLCSPLQNDKSKCVPVDDIKGTALAEHLTTLRSQMNALNESQEIKKSHEEVSKCLKITKIADRVKCANDIRAELEKVTGSDLSKAKEKLKLASARLKDLRSYVELQKLEDLKYITLAALQSKGCIDGKEVTTTGKIESYCDTPDIEGHVSNVLDLGDDSNKILLSLNYNLYDKSYKKRYGKSAKLDTYKGVAKKHCSDDDYKHSAICKHITKNKEEKEAEIEKQARDNERRIASIKTRKRRMRTELADATPKESAVSYAAKGAAIGLAQNMNGIIGLMRQNRQHEYQMNYYQNLYDYRQWAYSPDTVHYQNFYQWNYDPLNFNSTNAGLVDMTNFSYSFSTIPANFTTNNGLNTIYDTSINTNTNINSVNSFNFTNP